MIRLNAPIRRALQADADAAALERTWRGVARRRAERARRQPLLRWAPAAAAAAALVIAALFLRGKTVTHASEAIALHLAGGGAIGQLEAPFDSSRTYTLSDGSVIALGPGAVLEALENGPTGFSALLARGRVTFDVQPGGPRRWSVETGLMTVEVVGTRFTVERTETAARVEVDRGVVLVRGERVPDRVQRLTAGQSLQVEEGASEIQSAPATVTPPDAGSRAPAIRSAAPAPPSGPSSSSWRAFEQQGDHAQAYAALGSEGIARESRCASVEDLLALADVARLSGHPADAVEPLSRVVSEHADDPRAPLAAFTLGRLELDTLNTPKRAADAFSRAIELGLPETLQEDAHARLVESYARAGESTAAQAAARDYERRFPSGKRLDDVRRWTQ